MSVGRKEDITYKKSEKEDIKIVKILVNERFCQRFSASST